MCKTNINSSVPFIKFISLLKAYKYLMKHKAFFETKTQFLHHSVPSY